MPRLSTLLMLICVPLIVGCDGCRRDPDARKEEQEQAPLDAFTIQSPDPFPSAGILTDGGVPAGRALKPGHWITASVGIKSNLDDVRGELISRAGTNSSDLSTGRLNSSSGSVVNSRPVVLPKGQLRRFDYRILPPVPDGGSRKTSILGGRLVTTGRSSTVTIPTTPFIAMSPEEYFIVILTERPERFTKLRGADWIKPYHDKLDFPLDGANYRIVVASTKDIVSIAETMLDWTNTAYVIWDDVPEDVLMPDQRRALADWIRFGGQLIVNGPEAADALSRGTLSEVLPMKPSGHIELDTDDGKQLLQSWQVETDTSTGKQIAILEGQSGRIAVDGALAEDAESLSGSGNLILRRKIGRGCVTQSRVDLTSDWLVDWWSFDSFFNGAILNRSPRRFFREPGGAVRLMDTASGKLTVDASANTHFRIASRDSRLGRPGVMQLDVFFDSEVSGESRDDAAAQDDQPIAASESSERPIQKSLPPRSSDPYTLVDAATGVGGWTDTSEVMSAFRDVLRSESGIEIPKSTLVIRSLGYYLLVLVPINFIVFRLMGRLEYAWLAVPVIALVGAIWVARAARLDIGFARSQTELALLELQTDYPRGHLCRVDAIYNSLSSTYQMDFETTDGVALPIRSELKRNEVQSQPVLKTSYDEGPSLAGVAVGSNQVRLLHAEQMIDVGGVIVIDQAGKLVNQSQLEIMDVVVIEKTLDGEVLVASVGLLGPSANVTLRFRDDNEIAFSGELPMQTSTLMQRLGSPSMMAPGSIRMVGRIDTAMGGMSIEPKANQVNAQTIVLVHLQHPAIALGKPDANLLSDLQPVRRGLGDSELDSQPAE
ncbi:hypothetical protein K227x_41560 [Rubripirellula lacrimiformis]|uniref:Uncharacterized protein n=1 Tax=Rubripirellula lacrimiformis TaxID=1930273 RepID=A0A517NF44_9BACT|nr:hypothetical protein [Rubripirellula lacrimiformis]QDT05752.1 hypothetical protein K227x_41560 [Rubripirellula lacrimiformis]